MASSPKRDGSDGPRLVSWYDRERRIIHLGEQHRRLTPDEATIVDCLLERPGRLATKDHIIFSVWIAQGRDEPEDAGKVLQIHVSRLRERGLPIETVWGKGYRLELPGAEFEVGETYRGRDEVGELVLLKMIREPVLLLRDRETGEELHVPLSGARLLELEAVGE